MPRVVRPAICNQCVYCRYEWFPLGINLGMPRQCPRCGRSHWMDGAPPRPIKTSKVPLPAWHPPLKHFRQGRNQSLLAELRGSARRLRYADQK